MDITPDNAPAEQENIVPENAVGQESVAPMNAAAGQEEFYDINRLLKEYREDPDTNGFMYKGVKVIRILFTIFGILAIVGGAILCCCYMLQFIDPLFSKLGSIGGSLLVVGGVLMSINELLFRGSKFYGCMAMEKFIVKRGLDANKLLKVMMQNTPAGDLSRMPKKANLEPEAYQLATAALNIVNGEKSKTIIFHAIYLGLGLIINSIGVAFVGSAIPAACSALGLGIANGSEATAIGGFIQALFLNASFFSLLIFSIGEAIFKTVWNNKKAERENTYLHATFPEAFPAPVEGQANN